jgi:hypothetical protein
MEDVFTYTTIPRWILLRIRMFSDQSCREDQNIYFKLSNFFFRKSCRLWDNVEKYGGARQAAENMVSARGIIE